MDRGLQVGDRLLGAVLRVERREQLSVFRGARQDGEGVLGRDAIDPSPAVSGIGYENTDRTTGWRIPDVRRCCGHSAVLSEFLSHGQVTLGASAPVQLVPKETMPREAFKKRCNQPRSRYRASRFNMLSTSDIGTGDGWWLGHWRWKR